jgi:prophage maintenance system killer protein
LNWVFLDVAGVKSVQSDLIETYGGSHGLRDAGLLESAALVDMLRMNGHQLTAPEPEQIAMVLAVASSELSEADWTTWVESHIAPLHS